MLLTLGSLVINPNALGLFTGLLQHFIVPVCTLMSMVAYFMYPHLNQTEKLGARRLAVSALITFVPAALVSEALVDLSDGTYDYSFWNHLTAQVAVPEGYGQPVTVYESWKGALMSNIIQITHVSKLLDLCSLVYVACKLGQMAKASVADDAFTERFVEAGLQGGVAVAGHCCWKPAAPTG
jgi:hypothetical protein